MERSYSLSEFTRSERHRSDDSPWRDQSRPSCGTQDWSANNYHGRGRQGLARTVGKSAAASSRRRWGAVMGMIETSSVARRVSGS